MSEAGYTVKEAAALLELPAAHVRAFVQAGFVSAEAAEAEEPRFTFQDLVLLRTAKGLAEKQFSTKRIQRALSKLKEQLPAQKPLTGVVIAAQGEDIVVRDGTQQWNPESGQVMFDFKVDELAARGVEQLRGLNGPDADELYAQGCALEETDGEGARQAYERAIALEPRHADAHVNLGRLFHENGRYANAEKHYRLALTARPNDATAAFNLAVSLDDQDRIDEAIAAYVKAIDLDEGCSEAYFNLSRLYERKGEKVAALRHLKEYKRLATPRS